MNSTQMYLSYLLVFCIFKTCMASDQFIRVPLYRDTILSNRNVPLNYTRPGRVFYGKVSAGTPPQHFKVLYDTGSASMWLASTECTSLRCMEHHRYNHNISSTYVKNGTYFVYKYGAGNATGFWSYDDVTIADIKVKKQQFGEVTRINFKPSLGTDGIVGLGFKVDGVNTVMDNMIQQHVITNPVASFYMSSHFQEEDQVGEMVLGGSDPEHYIGEFIYMPAASVDKRIWPEVWEIKLDGLYVNGKNFLPNVTLTILDTGNSGFHGPPEVIEPMLKELRTNEKHNISCSEVSKQPDIVFEFNGKKFPLKAKNYYWMVSDNMCQIDVHSIPIPIQADPKMKPDYYFLLGQIFMEQYYTEFDFKNQRIGFASSK